MPWSWQSDAPKLTRPWARRGRVTTTPRRSRLRTCHERSTSVSMRQGGCRCSSWRRPRSHDGPLRRHERLRRSTDPGRRSARRRCACRQWRATGAVQEARVVVRPVEAASTRPGGDEGVEGVPPSEDDPVGPASLAVLEPGRGCDEATSLVTSIGPLLLPHAGALPGIRGSELSRSREGQVPCGGERQLIWTTGHGIADIAAAGVGPEV
jgi:hypothetical protein